MSHVEAYKKATEDDVRSHGENSSDESCWKEVSESILDHVQECPAVFRSQQMGDPELTVSDKRRIAECMLLKKPVEFLIRFGQFLKEEHFNYFLKKYETSYEIEHYVTVLKKHPSGKEKNIARRNRRFEAMRRLENNGDYFSEEEMKKREPLLYFQMVGQYLNEKEKLKKFREANRNKIPTFSNFLLDKIDKEDLNELMAQQQKEEEEHMDMYEFKNAKNDICPGENTRQTNVIDKWGADWDDEKNETNITCKKPIHKNFIPSPEEKVLLYEEFKSIVQNKFLCGDDNDFNYSEVDSNSDYDCLEIKSQDEEEKYFDEETCDCINGCTDTGVEDY
ncbi:hypothetical protein RUM43_014166 [Polyplax serrata]|uniref:CCD97-like C-terminal domain-containing protein n=1 Tax=Polyplax serrata TaxID=468196 RepID=A0AAN8PT25_POLSC